MYNHDIYRLMLYKTSNFMAISKYTHYSMSLIIYTIFKIKATVYSLLKVAIILM